MISIELKDRIWSVLSFEEMLSKLTEMKIVTCMHVNWSLAEDGQVNISYDKSHMKVNIWKSVQALWKLINKFEFFKNVINFWYKGFNNYIDML